jgi:acyl-CoA reductase-like NAD-dependent aldehyde dehydrogenase
MTAGSASDAVGRARSAQPAWAATAVDRRVDIVRTFRRLVDERRDELAGELTADMGKPISQARNELAGVLARIDWFIDRVPQLLEPSTVLDDAEHGLQELTTYDPLGVVVNISAWNYPWFVGANVFVPALLTGNTVLYKPSEIVPRTGRAIASLLHEAGVPDNAFILVEGGPDAGASLLEADIDGVFFTGSYATGRRIAEAVAGRMIPVQLELGGKDAVYVTDDVQPTIAAESLADGAFYNNGQSCCSVERIYVHDAVYDEFVDAFVKNVEGFALGDPNDDDTYIGPLARPQQVEVLQRQVDEAAAGGARVLVGGHAIEGRGPGWFEPTVVVDVDNTMALMRDESFGPVIGIARVSTDDEAVGLMNDTEFGLTAGVYGTDEVRARSILAQLDTGSAYWNCCDRVSPRLPWSGRRHSGIGSTLGVDGIRAFVRPRAWHLRSG